MKPNEVVISLGALAQESRLGIFTALVKRGPEGLTPSQLGAKLGIASTTLSFHLKELQHAHLIGVRREGRSLFYWAQFDHMRGLVAFLTSECCSDADADCDSTCRPIAPDIKRRRA